MKPFILLAAMLLALSGTLAACNLPIQAAKPAVEESGGGGGY